MTHPTPSARSVKEAAKIVRPMLPSFLQEVKDISSHDWVQSIALLLDQRERETWRDAAAVLEKKKKECAVSKVIEQQHTGKFCTTCENNERIDAARSALLSEAERRGMVSKSGDGGEYEETVLPLRNRTTA